MAFGSEIARLFVRLSADTSEFKAAMREVSGSVDNVGSNLAIVGSKFSKAGQAMTLGLTAPIIGIGAIAAKASIDFESAFAGVRKTVDATEAQFAELRQGIRDMAKEMPASATEIAKVAESAGQLGIARKDILAFTETMIKLGATTNLTADDAATAFARIANIMQIPISDVDNLAAALVELGNNGASTESEIVQMALRIAGAGKQVGLSGDQVLAFANALSSVGIEAESGGSAISRAFIEIANSVADGGKKLDQFAEVAGMSSEAFAQAFKTDAAGAMVTFIEGLKRVSDAGGNVFKVLDDLDLGEIRVRDALLRASGAGDLFRQSLVDGARAMKENIALDVEYEKRKETTAAKLEILKNRLMDVAITMGDALIPALIKAIDAAEPLFRAIQFMAEAFAGLPGPVQTVIVGLAALVAIIGPLLLIIGGMASGLSAVIGVMGALGAVAGVSTVGIGGLAVAFGGLVIAALPWIALAVAIGAGLYLLIKNWDDVSAAVSRAASVIKDLAIGAFNAVLNFLRSNWQEVATLVSGPFMPLVALATDAFGIRTALVNAFNDLIAFMGTVPGMILSALGDVGDLLYNAGLSIIRGLWKGMADQAVDMLNWVANLAGKIASLKGPLSKDKRLLIPQGVAIMEGLSSGLERGFKYALRPILKQVTSDLQNAWSGLSPSVDVQSAISPVTSRPSARTSSSLSNARKKNISLLASSGTGGLSQGLVSGAGGGTLASTGSSATAAKGLKNVGDAATKAGKALSSIPAAAGMIRAEDGSMVPASFYDKTDLTPVAKPSAAKTTTAKTSTAKPSAPASASAVDDITKAVEKEGTAATKSAAANTDLAASLSKVDSVGKVSAETIQEVGEQTEDAGSKSAAISGSIDGMKKALGGLAKTGANAFAWMESVNLGDKMIAAVGGALQSVGDTLTNFKDSAFSKAADLGNAIGGGITGALNAAGGLATGIASIVSTAFENAKTSAGTGITNLVAFIGENFTAYNMGQAMGWFLLWPVALFRESFALVTSVVTTFMLTTLPNLFLQGIPGLMSVAMTTGINLATSIGTGLGNGLAKISEFFVVTLPLTIATAAVPLAEGALKIGQDYTNGIANGMIGAAPKVATFFTTTLPGIISGGVTLAINAAAQIGTAIVKSIADSVTAQMASIRALPGVIVNAFMEGFNFFKGAWENIGKSIVYGVGSGISSAAGWLQNQVKSFFSGVYNAAKGAIGMKSPSKLFAKVGESIMQGVGVGLQSEYAGVSNALNDMLTNLGSGARPGFPDMTAFTQPPRMAPSMRDTLASRPLTSGASQGGLVVNAYNTVVNNNERKQDANKALGDLAFATAAELRSRGVLI